MNLITRPARETTAAEYVRALGPMAGTLPNDLVRLLQAHVDAPAAAMTPFGLAKLLNPDAPSVEDVALIYGNFGAELVEHLNARIDADPAGLYGWWNAFLDCEQPIAADQYSLWTLRQSFVEALVELRIICGRGFHRYY
jgi:hypothetical protein